MGSPGSAGLLLFRRRGGDLEVLLGHMGGPFWRSKDVGAWTVPKGEYERGEDPHAAAVREFTEELGAPPPPGEDVALGTVRQRGGKVVTAWAREGDFDESVATSNVFEVEWPPGSGRLVEFPELDRVAWLPAARARELVVRAQAELIDRLLAVVDPAGATRPDG